VIDYTQLSRRSQVDRPLAKLTDDELHALHKIGDAAHLLNAGLCELLETVGQLAFLELANRELAAELAEVGL
jgi:hypothetical protein